VASSLMVSDDGWGTQVDVVVVVVVVVVVAI
jgi:hypothetical protein